MHSLGHVKRDSHPTFKVGLVFQSWIPYDVNASNMTKISILLYIRKTTYFFVSDQIYFILIMMTECMTMIIFLSYLCIIIEIIFVLCTFVTLLCLTRVYFQRLHAPQFYNLARCKCVHSSRK